MMTILQSIAEDHSVPSPSATDTSSLTSDSAPAANALSQQTVQLEMLKLLRELKMDLSAQRAASASGSGGGGNDDTSARKRKPRKTPDDATFPRSITTFYCWTHGGCNHTSKDCKRRAPGHKIDATFDNRMGGSCAYCPL